MASIFERLANFIRHEMKMMHIYQPAILIKLLSNGGKAELWELAQTVLMWDESQIEYYETIVKRHPTITLVDNHGILEKNKNTYRLKGFAYLSEHEIKALKHLCQEKIDDYIAKYGDRIWAHRGNYDIARRDRDSTASVDDADHYAHREAGCVFCNMGAQCIIAENQLCIAVHDAYPVTEGHALIIPKRHVPTLFELYQPEINATHALLNTIKQNMQSQDGLISGFNMGANIGRDAGQTIDHCHIHLIPRRAGDLDDPRGGIRGVIPDKRIY